MFSHYLISCPRHLHGVHLTFDLRFVLVSPEFRLWVNLPLILAWFEETSNKRLMNNDENLL